MSESLRCCAGALLDTWSDHGWTNGLQLERLSDLESLAIETENSRYEITILSGSAGDVLVRGGRFFPDFTQVRFAGCTLGGSFLKVGGIYVGFRMEFQVGTQAIVTSQVRSIGVVQCTAVM